MTRIQTLLITCCLSGLATDVMLAEVPSQLFRREGQRGNDYYTPDDEPARITTSEAVVTPHIAWTKPCSDRPSENLHPPLRILAIAHKSNGRWPLELAQRFHFDVTTVYAHARDHLGVRPTDGFHGSPGRVNQRPADVEARLLRALHEPIDVIISDLPLKTLGEKVSQRLANVLNKGIGNVGPSEGLELAHYKRAEDAERTILDTAVPLDGLAASDAHHSEQLANSQPLKL